MRVFMAVDLSNLYFAARNLKWGHNIDLDALLYNAVDFDPKRELIRASAYLSIKDEATVERFQEVLKQRGYHIYSKDVIFIDKRGGKCNFDVEIAVDAMMAINKMDTFVLASGDGDFAYLLHTLRHLGIRTEVLSFPDVTSHLLLEEADRFCPLDERDIIKKSPAIPGSTEHK